MLGCGAKRNGSETQSEFLGGKYDLLSCIKWKKMYDDFLSPQVTHVGFKESETEMVGQ